MNVWHFFQRSFLCAVGMIAWISSTTLAWAIDFQQVYTKGKTLLDQKLYADAIKELSKAVNEPTHGAKHFGAHYYLGLAHYRLGHIAQAMHYLQKAQTLPTTPAKLAKLKLLQEQMNTLFGSFRITPKVDPDQVGRLLIQIESKTPFSHPQKQRIYRILQKRWQEQGLVPNNALLYLPKGEYLISISKKLSQCLRYALITPENAVVREITIGEKPVFLALQEQQSCPCTGGQILQKEGKKLFCACPKETIWSQHTQRCEIPVKESWIARNWIWVTLLGAGVVAGGAVAIYFIASAQSRPPGLEVQGKLFNP